MRVPKFRFSKKLLFIMMGSIVVLGGGSGAAAVFIGTDKFIGPSYLEVNGLKCSALDTVKIKKDQRTWIRKYVVNDEPGDGVARIKTALRVARAVQAKEKADIVLVAMVDKSGPKTRAQIRGRTVGAQVIYIPDTTKAPDGMDVQTFSAYYMDGSAAPDGEFYGMRFDMPLEDIETMSASLKDVVDCTEPVVTAPTDAHGAPASGHGEKPKKGGGHDKPSGHGDASGHGAAPAGHGEAAPAAEGHGAAPAEGHGEGGEVAAKPSGGFLSSITGMIFGSKPEAPAEGHGAEGEQHAATPAEGHEAPAGEHGAAAVSEDHGDQKPAAGKPTAGDGHGAPTEAKAESKPVAPTQVASADPKPAAAEAKPAEPKKEEGGFIASLTGMIFGGNDTQKTEPAKAGAAPEAKGAEPTEAPPPRTSAEGGKRWSKQTDADSASAGHAPVPNIEAEPPKTDGSTAADAAGAAWLAKLRGETVVPKP